MHTQQSKQEEAVELVSRFVTGSHRQKQQKRMPTMRCKACDDRLTHEDTSRKSLLTGEYLDLCRKCYSTIQEDVPTQSSPVPETDAIDEEEILRYE
jgi:protein-arginine kinase activator protein McsA